MRSEVTYNKYTFSETTIKSLYSELVQCSDFCNLIVTCIIQNNYFA